MIHLHTGGSCPVVSGQECDYDQFWSLAGRVAQSAEAMPNFSFCYVTSRKNQLFCAPILYRYIIIKLYNNTVEPLTNDHPHQRPSLSYDHILCDGQWFLFVYESLTSDHPSYTTTPM